MRLHALSCAALCLLVACDDDDGPELLDAGGDADVPVHDAGIEAGPGTRHVELKFSARLTDRGELRCGQEYAGQGSVASTVTPRDFRFYVESVMLHATTGEEVPLVFDDLESGGFQTPEVALINFTTSGGACEGELDASNTSIRGTAPGNLTYDGVRVVIGVPESLNHGNPTTAPGPLQAPDANWDWTAGYRFLIAEVVATQLHDAGMAHETLDAGSGGMDGGHAGGHGDGHGGSDAGGHAVMQRGVGMIHLGSTACTKEGALFSCARANRAEFTLSGFNLERDLIVADLGAVFASANLDRGVQCHGSGAACASMFESLGVDIETGVPLATQRVFSAAKR